MNNALTNAAGKHPDIRDQLRRRICQEGFSGRIPSIREIAREYGVHAITAGKAVDALVAEGLVRSVPRRGCFVVRRRVRDVAVMAYCPNLEPGFYAGMVGILTGRMPDCHLRHRVHLKGSGSYGEGFPAPDDLGLSPGGAVLTVGLQDRDYLVSLMAAGFPTVALDYVPTDPAISAVGVDNLAAGSEATRHLIAAGARDVLFVGHGRGSRTEVDALLLEVGYRVAMEEAGLKPRSVFAAHAAPGPGKEAFAAALTSGGVPDAVFTSNPQVLKGVWQCCRERDLPSPAHQISLDFRGEFPQLPAVRIDMERFCGTALDLLLRQTADPSLGPRQVLVRTRIDVPRSL